jgi:hypothetical protein
LAASLASASAPRSKVAPRPAASSRLTASTAFSQAALTQTGEPSAAEIQAGVERAFRNAAKRGAVGRPWSSPSTAEMRSHASAPAARPSTVTTPAEALTSKAQASPRSNRARSLRA